MAEPVLLISSDPFLGASLEAIALGRVQVARLDLATRPAAWPAEPTATVVLDVAAALAAASLTERAAGAIIALLDRVAFRAGADALETAEKTLVEQAPGLPPERTLRCAVIHG